MFLLELSTNNYEEENTFLIKIPYNLETSLFKFFYLNLFVLYV